MGKTSEKTVRRIVGRKIVTEITEQFGFDPPPEHAIHYRAFTPRKKEQVICRLLKLWLEHPELRLMQLLGNIFDGDPYYVEDFDMIDQLEAAYKNNKINRKKASDEAVQKTTR